MQVKRAKKADVKDLTELTIKSKSHWGYGEKQIEEWRGELTITEKYIEENHVYKLIDENSLIGFYAYKPQNKTTIKLNYLFIEPKFIGSGCGKLLMTHFLKLLENSEYQRVTLDADPNAEVFYQKNGFRVIGKLPSSIKNRYLPIMEFELK
ncbi:GNAT family N-acetyltransferase [uncultured Croceitalea sp.]|uniref:GNAT family N-acetyltransferase n=1 Tax=uncultured Croceitalea sp. TaxID=1798908 RepID=UPI003305ABB1